MKLTLLKNGAEVTVDPADLELEALCPGTVEEGCLLGRNQAGGVCSTCDGRGIVVTPIGLHILAFVVNHAAWYRQQQKKSHGQKN